MINFALETFSNCTNQIYKYFYGTSEPLEPISSLAVLALLRFKDPTTKLGLSSGRLVLQQPTLQGFWRTVRGDRREDLACIKHVIKMAALIFHPEKDETIRKLFTHALKGLNALHNTYKNKPSYKDPQLALSAIKQWQALIKTACKDGLKSNKELPTYADKIKNLWETTEIEIINQDLDRAENKQSNSDVVSKTIEVRIVDKTEKFRKILESDIEK